MPRGHLPTALENSFASGRCLPVLLFQVDLPDQAPLCLLYGSGQLSVLGQTFVGSDDRFGALDSLTPPEDGVGDQAPNMSFVINCPSDASSATLASALYQGSRCRLWVGGLDPDEAQPTWLGEYLIFDGELDRPILEGGTGELTLDFDVVSGFERLFSDSEGARLADSSHQVIWPGELGFVHVSGIQRTIVWGPGDRPGGSSYGGGPGGNGGGRAWNWDTDGRANYR